MHKLYCRKFLYKYILYLHSKGEVNIMKSLDSEIIKKLVKLRGDSVRYIPSMIIPGILSLLTISIFTRVFQPNEYGQYVLVITVVNIVSSMMSALGQSLTLRFLPKFEKEGKLLIFEQHFVIIVFSEVILLGALGFLLYPLRAAIFGKYTRFYFLAVLLVILGAIFENIFTIFRAKLQSGEYSKYRISYAIMHTTLSLIFIFLISKDVIVIIFAIVVSYIILIPLMLKELDFFHSQPLPFKINIPYIKKFVFYGFPMVGWIVSVQLLNLSDRFLIEILRNSYELGIYSANYNLACKGIGLILSPIMLAAHPLIMTSWESKEKEKTGEIISNFSRYLLLIGIFFVTVLSLFSLEIVSIFLGSAVREGYIVIPIIALSYLIWTFSMFGHKGLEFAEETKIIFISILFCVILNIILNIIFIPKYGYIAAAFTTLISHLSYLIITYKEASIYIKWNIPWQSMKNSIISSLLVGGLLTSCKFIIFTGIVKLKLFIPLCIFGFLMYVVILYFLKEFRNYEILYMQRKMSGLINKIRTLFILSNISLFII